MSDALEHAFTANEKSADRYHALDALRGLAALVVVLMHFHDLLFGKERRMHLSHVKLALLYLASPFRSGESAVALFFVLSGFVLALPILKGKRTSYLTYAVRRIIRIYLPYLAALAFSVWGAFHFHGQLPRGMWIVSPWAALPTTSTIVNHVLFIGTYDLSTFNFAFWTLVIELRLSLVYPFLVMSFMRLPFKAAIGIAFGALAVLTLLALHNLESDLFRTLRFCCFFLAGLFIAWQREPIRRWYNSLSRRTSAALLLTALLLSGYVIALRAPAPILEFLCLISAASIIVCTLYDRQLRTMLERKIPQFLGQISYSLYLIHLPVLFVSYLLIGKRMPTFFFLALYLVAAVSAATLFYFLIERPCVLLSRRMGARR